MKTVNDYSNAIWEIGDSILRDKINKAKWDEILLPFIVLRRLDCLLLNKYEEVSAFGSMKERYKNGKLDDNAVKKFYETNNILREKGLTNTYITAKMLEAGGALAYICNNEKDLRGELINYVKGFQPEVQEILTKLCLMASDQTSGAIEQLEGKSKDDDADMLKAVLARIIEDFNVAVLSPDVMGNLFEELIRRFNEAKKTDAGEHYTPRDAIKLLTLLLLNGDLPEDNSNVDFYDPTCGTGGILFVGEEEIKKRCAEAGRKIDVELYGQEINDFTQGICQADLLIQAKDFRNIKQGNTLAADKFEGRKFRYQGANPPYGVKWGGKNKEDVEEKVRAEIAKGEDGRYPAGAPKTTSEGQLLFLQHMISKMQSVEKGGGRLAIVMNGNPLFAADAGQGDSNIRGWMLRNDLVEAIVALPRDMFFNTGIATYIWVVTNKKTEKRKGRVQLIDASGMGVKMSKSKGNKRKELNEDAIKQIQKWHGDKVGEEVDKRCKIVNNDFFGYYSVKIEAPEIIEEIPVFKVNYTTPKRDESGNIVKTKTGKVSTVKGFELVSLAGFRKEAEEDYTKKNLNKEITETAQVKAKEQMIDNEIWSDEITFGKVDVNIINDVERLFADTAPVSALLKDTEALNEVNTKILTEWARKEIKELRPKNAPDFKVLDFKIGWEIPLTKIFYEYIEPEDPSVIAERLQGMFNGLVLDTSFLPNKKGE